MPIADTRPAPGWVEAGATSVQGIDLLGLRLPVQTIGNWLLNGITSVTPSVRYLSFRCWIARSYMNARLPDRWRAFRAFASQVEAAIVLGNLIQAPRMTGLVGADAARERLASGADPVELGSLVKQLAVGIYTGPSDQLGLSFSAESGVPGLFAERGIPVAAALGEALEQTALGRAFGRGLTVERASLADLAELGAATALRDVPAPEREALVATVLPERPRGAERRRVASYSLLLALARQLGRLPAEDDLFAAAAAGGSDLPPQLGPCLDGWLTYCVRDMLAMAHEAVLQAVLDALERHGVATGALAPCAEVVAGVLAREGDLLEALHDLRLAERSEDLGALSFRDLARRVEEATSRDLDTRSGLVRWGGPLTEPRVGEVALSAAAGSAAVLAVAWLLALRRVETGSAAGEERTATLSYQGWERIGLEQVVKPLVERFLDDDVSLRQAMAELVQRTIDQHLRVAWSRMADDASRDVTVLFRDGDRLGLRRAFVAGFTAARIAQAVDWLSQLRLADGSGITADGSAVLERCLGALSEEA